MKELVRRGIDKKTPNNKKLSKAPEMLKSLFYSFKKERNTPLLTPPPPKLKFYSVCKTMLCCFECESESSQWPNFVFPPARPLINL